ncbi:hypothetical protein N7492_000230 [Penicillium capsulatum]|uniref:F-box domain-containing protein n=1 Tax=Penicillium capsulatum TaxID=69766 RepID=A0A9W9IRD4_9EURO|nr:hypothetical protein N7492_000230 [Penicillium capsulatum]KAJ6130704.1 hypothetical protein N7512_003484 [Penicillium capsulatum]
MPLNHLPNEILLAIAENLRYAWDVNALSQVNRTVHAVIDTHLYRHHLPLCRNEATIWAFEKGDQTASAKQLRADAWELLGQDIANQVLIRAVKSGDHQALGHVIESLPTPLSFDTHLEGLEEGQCCLLCGAVENGHTQLVRMMLAHGADKSHAHGQVPLLFFSSQWYSESSNEMIRFLIEEIGCDPNEKSQAGLTPLGLAINQAAPETAKTLLEYGANPNLRFENRDPVFSDIYQYAGFPIVVARYTGSSEILQLLIDHGADASFSDLDEEVRDFNVATGKILANHLASNGASEGPESRAAAFLVAVIHGKEDVVQELLHQGFEPDESRCAGIPANPTLFGAELQWAVHLGHESLVEVLINHRQQALPAEFVIAILREALSKGFTHIAEFVLTACSFDQTEHRLEDVFLSALDHIPCFELLLKHGADPNTNLGSKYLIEHVLMDGKIDMLQILLDRGVPFQSSPVGKSGPAGMNDLMFSAITRGNVGILELFKDKINLPSISAATKERALRCALEDKNLPVALYLLRHGVQVKQTFAAPWFIKKAALFARSETDSDMGHEVLDLILHHVNIDCHDRNWRSCLWDGHGDIPFLKVLLEKGADPLSSGPGHMTPLVHTVICGRSHGEILEAVRVFLGSIDLTGRNHSPTFVRDELRQAEIKAQETENWKLVRLLQRFRLTEIGDTYDC